VRELGVELRAGLHTGECEAIGEDVGGLAVHIGARVGALAAPREVLVSNTVKDLVVGSGIDFADRAASMRSRGCLGRGACGPLAPNARSDVAHSRLTESHRGF
jgi:class 3 adenylate cyclase